MSGVDVRQAAFIAGEIAPGLYARADLPLYQVAVRRCANFIVRPTGGVDTRGGLRLVAEAPTSVGRLRLLPFKFSNGQTYVLEFGHFYIRILSSGGIVLDSGTLAPVQLVSPYEAADLARLDYAQSGDIVTLVHSLYPIHELRRLAHDSWTLTPQVLTRSVSAPTGVVWAVSNPAEPTDPTFLLSHPLKEWAWVVTAVSGGDRPEESLPSAVLSRTTCLYPDSPRRIEWAAVVGAVSYNVYRGRNGVFGFVGRVEGQTHFFDDAPSPAYSEAPPTGRDPFSVPTGYPSSVAYIDQRLTFAGAPGEPQTVKASKSGNYKNFDTTIPPNDDDAVTFTLAALQFDEIRALVPMRVALIFTASAVYVLNGDGQPLTPTSIDPRPHAGAGSAWVRPEIVGRSVLVATEPASGLLEVAFEQEADGYGKNDLSLVASHLFEGRSIVDMAWADKPYRVLWVVRDDGMLLGLTFVREQSVAAWHRHTTDGVFESVAVVPEGTGDAVYVAVARTIGGVTRRFVERMAPLEADDARFAVQLDSSVSFDGRNASEYLIRFYNPATSDAFNVDGFVFVESASAGLQFTPDDVGATIIFEHETGPVRCRIVRRNSATRVRVQLERTVPPDLYENDPPATVAWSWGRQVFKIPHLAGETVSILSDGHVCPPQVVGGSGEIFLEAPGTIVHVGLAYTPEVETIDYATEAGATRPKRVAEVAFDVVASRGLWFGEDPEKMTEWKQRKVSDDYEGAIPLEAGTFSVTVASSWKVSGRVLIQVRDPLPAQILAIHPRLELGG